MFDDEWVTGRAEKALADACAALPTQHPTLQVVAPDRWNACGGIELDPDWVARAHDRLVERLDHPTRAPSAGPAPASEAPRESLPETGAAADDSTFEARAARFQAEIAADAALLETARAAEAEIARAQAARARALAAFAARRPVSLDRPDDQVGAAARASRATRPEALRAVSEFCVDEVAVGLSMNPHAATALLVQSLRLVDRLPGTLAALQAGTISWAHVVIACELIAPLSAQLRALAEDTLIGRAVGRSPQSWRPMVRRLVMKLDADAITARVADAVRERKVVVYPAADGMATLCATLPLPVARAVEDLLRRHAHAVATPGDDRSLGERMADCLIDLLLNPHGHSLTPVQAQLTVVASVRTLLGGTDGAEPGEIGGEVVPASMVRELAAALGLLPADPAPTPSGHLPTSRWTGPDDATEDATVPASTPEPVDASAGRRAALAALLATRDTTGTGLAARPTIALVDEDTGELVAITDATGLRRAVRDGTGLGPPPETPGYEPSAALAAFVRLRDRRCQFPGCRARPAVCDLDHQHPWLSGGATAHDNLACLCRHHHRLSHQAPGWTLTRTPDRAGLTWTTPTGQVTTTRPPVTGHDDNLVDGEPAATDPGATADDPSDAPPF